MQRRQWLRSAVTGVSAVLAPSLHASSYPTRPIRVIVAFSPGGGTDTLARVIAPSLSTALGQSVFVENKPGAGAMIGSELVAKAPADGYTLLVTSVPHVTNPSLVKTMPFDTVRAFAPVSLAVQSPFILVVPPASPIRTLKDMVEQAKARKMSYASSGNGTADHLGMELFCSQAGMSMVHVPYKGTGPAMLDLVGGHVDMMFANVVGAAPHIKAGKLRAIAATSARRSALLPQLTTIAEASGRPFDVSAWTGVLAPTGTDPAIVDRLSREIRAAMDVPTVREALLANGADQVGSTPAEFDSFITREIDTWGRIIRGAGITVT